MVKILFNRVYFSCLKLFTLTALSLRLKKSQQETAVLQSIKGIFFVENFIFNDPALKTKFSLFAVRVCTYVRCFDCSEDR